MKSLYSITICIVFLFLQFDVSANCFDGILNGDETEVDCGGSCADCDAPRAQLRFLLYSSFYFGENTFLLETDNPGEPSEVINRNQFIDIRFDAAKSDTFCVYYNLPAGCYKFSLFDSGNDGLQNFFEQGFYSLSLDGNEFASGGEFTNVDVVNFCVEFETCEDGIQNGEEEGIDCGGPDCEPCIFITCDDGIQNGDETGIDCGGSFCVPCFTCFDGIQNGDEEGVDCGGSFCEPCITCIDGIQNGDEEGIDCGGSFCEPCITCIDGIQNGDEEGIDCGGSFCEPCITCVDGIQNGDETGIDCGGSFCVPCFTCFDGIQNGDEDGIDCGGSFCMPCITCEDGIQNGDEEGVDCGGSNCEPCITCEDGIQNGDEDGIDCGGSLCMPCITCEDGIQNGDESGIDCGGSFCVPCFTCFDGIQNGDEEGIDCGGSFCEPCITCVDGIQNGDEEGIDCGGSFCEPCITCVDGIQNGDEEGVDCGGSFCEPCITCVDGIQNGDEEGIDCGGSFCEPCITCVDGIQNGDEEGIDCGGSFCEPCITCEDGIQNGDEEGIDCGGSFCEPCHPCIDGNGTVIEEVVTLCDSINLIAAQNYVAGSVTIERDNENLFITYTATGEWSITETHISIGDCNEVEIPNTGSDNPKIGNFEYAGNHDNEQTVVYTINLSELNISDMYCLAAHAVVVGDNGAETAWAEGLDFGGNSWAMYVENYLSDCILDSEEICISCTDGIQNWDEEGVDCGGTYCEPCTPCTISLAYNNIVCDNNGSQTLEDDMFTIDIIVTGMTTSGQWTGSLGDQSKEGNYGEAVTFGPFLTNAGSTISGWFMDAQDANCEMDIIIEAPIGCITCDDGFMNGDEEGIDCGGSFCEPCITCEDGIQNGDEEGIDCGGSFCEPCVPENSLTCTSNNEIIDTYVLGLEEENCITLPESNSINSVIAEVWICRINCSPLPNEITINGVKAQYAVETTGSVEERIYRVELFENLENICVEGISECLMSSLVIHAKRNSANSVSAVLTVDREFFHGDTNGDDCEVFSFPLGNAGTDRNIKVQVPIHEKDNGRTVSVTASIGNIVDSESIDSNISDEVALIELTLNQVPSNQEIIEIEICSPDNIGDSFGVGAVGLTATCDDSSTGNFNSNSTSKSSTNQNDSYWENSPSHEDLNKRTIEADASNSKESNLNMNIFPNPTRDLLNIEYSLDYDADVNIIITDINGKKLKSTTENGYKGENTLKLDVSQYGSGFYFFNLISGDSRLIEKFIIID